MILNFEVEPITLWEHWEKIEKIGDRLILPGILLSLLIDLYIHTTISPIKLVIYSLLCLIGILIKLVGSIAGPYLDRKLKLRRLWF